MAITKNHLIYDLKGLARNGEIADDDSFTNEQIGFWIDVTRAQLIKQAVDRGKSINPDIIQTLPCEDVIQVDAAECPDCVTTGCYILRTKNELPNSVESQYKNLITRVGSPLLGSTPFTFMPYERVPYTGHNPFTKNIVKAFLRNNYMYFISKKFFNKVAISGVWEFPEELGEYASCDGTSCYDKDSEYPISAYMVNILKDIVKQKDFGFGLLTHADVNNNANSEVEGRQGRIDGQKAPRRRSSQNRS